MKIETVAIRDEYITLGQLLKLVDFIQTGGEAKHFLANTKVWVNGEKENRRGKKLYPNDQVIVDGYGQFTIVRKSS